jgi:beta-lactamase class A
LRLREPEASTGGIEGRAGRRGAGRSRRERLFIWFSLFSAFVVAGSVLLLSGSLRREQSPVETIAQPPVAEPPVVEPPFLTRTPPDFDPELLRARLQEIAEDHEGVYGVAVLEPISGTEISLRGDDQFMAASIGKLPVFATLYREAARGGLDLEEEISILPEDIQDYGSGELQSFPEDYPLSLRECAYRLVNHSDTNA